MVDFRELCAELADALRNAIRVVYHEDGTQHISTAMPILRKARAALAAAQPAPPAEGEAAELVALINQIALAWEPDACLLGNMTAGQLARAAELLAQAHPTPPAPVPVSAGHPTNADCDRVGRCWWFDLHNGGAWFYGTFYRTCSHWLPAGAMPRPGVTTTTETP